MTYDHWKTTNPADEYLGPKGETVDALDLYRGDNFTYKDVENQALDLTITHVDKKIFKDGEKPKWVLTFAEHERKLGLNKTNTATLANLLGPKITDWIGGRANYYMDRTRDPQGKFVNCVRIREALTTGREKDADRGNGSMRAAVERVVPRPAVVASTENAGVQALDDDTPF